mmetsp:Transcript_7764/g.9252  ORF Transcript_7764/g.9252 Transcript_7764/m.9252 type:complete len:243 (-) Transcript_7764:216-944(-)
MSRTSPIIGIPTERTPTKSIINEITSFPAIQLENSGALRIASSSGLKYCFGASTRVSTSSSLFTSWTLLFKYEIFCHIFNAFGESCNNNDMPSSYSSKKLLKIALGVKPRFPKPKNFIRFISSLKANGASINGNNKSPGLKFPRMILRTKLVIPTAKIRQVGIVFNTINKTATGIGGDSNWILNPASSSFVNMSVFSSSASLTFSPSFKTVSSISSTSSWMSAFSTTVYSNSSANWFSLCKF